MLPITNSTQLSGNQYLAQEFNRGLSEKYIDRMNCSEDGKNIIFTSASCINTEIHRQNKALSKRDTALKLMWEVAIVFFGKYELSIDAHVNIIDIDKLTTQFSFSSEHIETLLNNVIRDTEFHEGSAAALAELRKIRLQSYARGNSEKLRTVIQALVGAVIEDVGFRNSLPPEICSHMAGVAVEVVTEENWRCFSGVIRVNKGTAALANELLDDPQSKPSYFSIG